MTETNQNNQELLRLDRLELCSLYAELSKVEECFPKTSKHKAYIFLDKRMREILYEIKEIDKKLVH